MRVGGMESKDGEEVLILRGTKSKLWRHIYNN